MSKILYQFSKFSLKKANKFCQKMTKMKPGTRCLDSIYPRTRYPFIRINWARTQIGTPLTGYLLSGYPVLNTLSWHWGLSVRKLQSVVQQQAALYHIAQVLKVFKFIQLVFPAFYSRKKIEF